MASSEDDVIVALIGAVFNRRRRKRKMCWIHPYLKENVDAHSAYVVAKQLELHEEKFQLHIIAYCNVQRHRQTEAGRRAQYVLVII